MRTISLALLLSACIPGEGVPLDDPIHDALDDTALDGLDLQAYDYDPPVPAHLEDALDRADNTPGDNPITTSGATLGRVLFWDHELSANRSLACASCHVDVVGFADDVPLSEGFDGGLTGRKSMPLVNLRYYRPGRMFWDERADSIEEQVLMPIQDDVEMGLSLDELVSRVSDAPYYGPLFEAAFGDREVTDDRISDALAQFVRSMTSFDSAWDVGFAATGDAAQPFPNYSAQENRGKDIFFGRIQPDGPNGPLCNACHLPAGPPPPPNAPPPPANPGIFFMPGPRVNGLVDAEDRGVGARTGVPGDTGRFKSPSLRNVELRAPYMHDGRFATLEAVVDFYSDGIQDVPNLDPVLRNPNGGPRRLNLSPADKAALVAFLKTLTDPTPALDERFADPFAE
ncbi:MAG: cytochrome-c peroxidase [Alphaproteobacteria bacterium]|nr:cytochrome-c peroxidase [Alphaproteobacteria bacterium]